MNCQGESQELCWHCQDPDCQVLPERNIQCTSCKEFFSDGEISDLNNKCHECCEKDWHKERAAEEAVEVRKVRRRQCKCLECGTQYSSFKYMVKGSGWCVNCVNKLIEEQNVEETYDNAIKEKYGHIEEPQLIDVEELKYINENGIL